MKKARGLLISLILMMAILLTGCQMMSSEKVKLRDLDFTIQSEETIPTEVMKMIKEKKEEPFKFTFTDGENLYICIGYGKQDRGGYSITVDALYLTEDAIYVETTLLGPDDGEKSQKIASYPYIVIKTESLDQTVVCE
jgi:hypothetical protein